jgi:Holliday junction DNA helicase RuvA
MIGRLKGTLAEVEGLIATLDVGGVGYEILVPESVLVGLPEVGETVELRIRQVFREDGVSLYGFSEAFQRRLFDLLMQVKGCGPKIGLALIGQLGEEPVAAAILAGDARALARANGVGPRLADRIILELKDKIAEESFNRRVAAAGRATVHLAHTPSDELVEALVALGYRRAEAEPAAAQARDEAELVEDQLKAALRSLKR